MRGTTSLVLGVTWCCGVAGALLRPSETVRLVYAIVTLLAWLASAVLHVLLWSRRTAAPILYLAIYWLLTAIAAASILWRHVLSNATSTHVEVYIQGLTTVLAFIMSFVDCVCFYDEVNNVHILKYYTICISEVIVVTIDDCGRVHDGFTNWCSLVVHAYIFLNFTS